MKIHELISFLGSHRVSLYSNGFGIQYNSEENIPDTVLDSINYYKSQIIHILNKQLNRKIVISPLSYNQQSLWFLYLLSPQSKAYNVAVPMQLNSLIDVDRLLKTIELLANCHDQLHASFATVSDEKETIPIQIISDMHNTELLIKDVSNLQNGQKRKIIEEFYSKPFDLYNGQVFRVGLFSSNKNDHILIFVFHHIICDAQSINIFLNDFNKIYPNGSIAPVKHNSYLQFISYQQCYLNNNLQKLQNYWYSKADCDRGGPLVETINKSYKKFIGESINFDLDNQIVQKVKTSSAKLSVTPFAFYLGCFQLLYMLISQKLSATIGVLSNGRLCSDFNNTIGYFVNPLPVFSTCSEDTSISDHIKRTHNDICEMLDNQNLPFSLLVEHISPNRSNGNTALFSVVFNMLSSRQLGIANDLVYPDSDTNEISFADLRIKPYQLNQQEGQFDATMELVERNDHIKAIFKYDSDLIDYQFAEQIIAKYKSIISETINSVDNSVSRLFGKINEKYNKKSTSKKISIVSTFTATILEETISFWSWFTGIDFKTVFSDYHQIEQFLSDPFLLKFESDYIVLLLRIEDLTYQDEKRSEIDIQFLRNRIHELTSMVVEKAKESQKRFIVCICPVSYKISNDNGLNNAILELEKKILDVLSNCQNILSISSDKIENYFSEKIDYEPSVGIIGQVPYTEELYEIIGTAIIREIIACDKIPCKAIITDCDNTLWIGVAGEKLLSQITIPQPIKEFQEFLKKSKENGIPICLCSKNNKNDVISIFENHPDMVLKLPDISFERINWQPKSQNVIEILKEANLSSAGVIFVDDNPAECAEVSANCPGIMCIHLSQNLKQRLNYIKNFWAFDCLKITKEDLSRLHKYRQEKLRNSFRCKTSSYSEFIEGLQIKIDIRNAVTEDIPRISQLSYRTNQFTLATNRMNELDVMDCLTKDDTFVVEVSDRFGEYGLVGVIIGIVTGDTYIVNTFLLSCRTLGRGVEYRCVSFIGELAKKKQCKTVKINFCKTDKNLPMQLFLQNIFTSLQTDGKITSYQSLSKDLERVVFIPQEYKQSERLPEKEAENNSNQLNNILLTFEVMNKIAEELNTSDKLHQKVLSFRKEKMQTIEKGDNKIVTDNIKQNDIEKVIHRIWSESLGKEQISIENNFFDVGGKSILLPHIILKINQALNVNVSIVDLFQYPTISSLAAYIAEPNRINNYE